MVVLYSFKEYGSSEAKIYTTHLHGFAIGVFWSDFVLLDAAIDLLSTFL